MAISSSEQRQRYKNDFNSEYSEYRDLHARIEQITRRFTQLDAQLRQLAQGSEEYEVCTAHSGAGLEPSARLAGPTASPRLRQESDHKGVCEQSSGSLPTAQARDRREGWAGGNP